MKYLSVCSGIEAASVAWEPLGWRAVGFAEIEPFPCELLKQRYPNVKNYGDMTKYENWDIGQFDVLVGGTPCQSFSVAGKRGGTNDIRGQLMYAYLGIVEKYKPCWVLWENVPGVLSSGDGIDFASFLAGLEQCGYGWAYRVLDAQYFGVPQRRRRVFVVGHIGNRCDLAAKVLFEQSSLCRDSTPGKKTRKYIAGRITKSIDEYGVPLCLHGNIVNRNNPYSGTRSKGYIANRSYALLSNNVHCVMQSRQVRRFTPLECERLQGFPDNWTRIKWRGKSADQCPDAPRYKAIGNSMAVPVMRWIGKRIQKEEVTIHERER